MPQGARRPECDTCPGYLISLPAVHDALSAHMWWTKGQLRDWIRGRCTSPHLNLYVDIAAGAVADVEVERYAEMERDRPKR